MLVRSFVWGTIELNTIELKLNCCELSSATHFCIIALTPSNATGKLPHFCHVKHRLEEILPRWHQLGDRAFVQHNNGEIKQIAMRSRRIIANK